VWTNVWAGAVLAGATWNWATLLTCIIALSAFYVGGMFLNDAFDRERDARERPERPIPAGHIGAQAVFVLGFALLGLGALGVIAVPLLVGKAPWAAMAAAGALAVAIVVYDMSHDDNAFAPWIMGICRGLVYVNAAAALGGTLTPTVLVGAASLSAYIVGLTFVARSELRPTLEGSASLGLLFAPVIAVIWLLLQRDEPQAFWLGWALWLGWLLHCLRPLLRGGPVMRAVVQLIAGISLLDAALAGVFIGPWGVLVGVLGTALTLYLQRVARGT
jgi:4-hydroxybenzoate polyprenyltransferase